MSRWRRHEQRAASAVSVAVGVLFGETILLTPLGSSSCERQTVHCSNSLIIIVILLTNTDSYTRMQ